jgi:hypothetical protein
VILGRTDRLRLGLRDVEADRFEEDVQVGIRTEGLEEARGVEVVGAEVVDHRPAAVQQGLDVDQLEGPDPFVEDATARGEASLSVVLGQSGAFQVLGAGGAEHPRGSVTRCWAHLFRRRLDLQQDLAQLAPAMRADHDLLATLVPGRICPESSHSGHQAISDQIRTYHLDPLRRDLSRHTLQGNDRAPSEASRGENRRRCHSRNLERIL